MENSKHNWSKCKQDITNLLFALSLICGYQNLSAQQRNYDAMELGKIIVKENNVLSFIDENLSDFETRGTEKLKVRHPLVLNKVNKMLVQPKKTYTLFGNPVNDMYAFRIGEEKFCLYLLIDLDAKSLSHIVADLGMPHNVSKEDYEARDFDFLAWHLSGIDIYLNKDWMGALHQEPGNTKSIMRVTNMPFDDIISKERIL